MIFIAIEVGFEVRGLWGEGRKSEADAREYREWEERKGGGVEGE